MAQPHLDLELSLYLDDALPAAERAAIRAHLDGCAACRAQLAELQGVVRLVAALPERAPSRSLLPRRTLLPRWLVPARWASSAAAAVFALAFVASSFPRLAAPAASAPAFQPAPGAAETATGQAQDTATKAQASTSPAPSANFSPASPLASEAASRYAAGSTESPRATTVPRGSGPEGLANYAPRDTQTLPTWLWLVAASLAAVLAAILWRWPRTLVR